MKYAFGSFSLPSGSLADLLALAQRSSYDGIEPRIGAGHGHGVELTTSAAQRRAIREQVAASGVALCCLSAPCRYSNPATTAQQTEETLATIDLAADVGAPLVRFFAGVIPLDVCRELATELVVTALRAVADHAAARGVGVCVETHDDWSDPPYLAGVMRAVNHSAIGIVWDVMHPVRQGGRTMDEAFEMLQPWIRHVHMHDGSASPDRREFVPIGTGDLDHRRVVALLAANAYPGFVSGEWLADWMPGWPPAEVYLPQELATMRGYEYEVGQTGSRGGGEEGI
ncbi:MAG: sugar phosphate isomerase/epimerase family protein [Thermomicrobiales bacterium]